MKPDSWETALNNRGLVAMVLRHLRIPDYQWDDAFQDGLLGLATAAEKFDPEMGFQFSTYAVPWVRQSVFRGLGRAEGINFRRAVASGEVFEPPLSLDWPVGEDGETVGQLVADQDGGSSGVLWAAACGVVEQELSDQLDLVLLGLVREGEQVDVSRVSGLADRFGVSVGFVKRRLRMVHRKIFVVLG